MEEMKRLDALRTMLNNVGLNCLAVTVLLLHSVSPGQFMKSVEMTSGGGVGIRAYTTAAGSEVQYSDTLPLFTFQLNDTLVSSLAANSKSEGDSITWEFAVGITGSVKVEKSFEPGWKAVVTFRNASDQTKQISNVVPLGEGKDRVFIKSAGPQTHIHRLSRSQLFRPGVGPIGVVLPDNAWELGFCDVKVNSQRSLVALARRTESGKADVRRFRTGLDPGGFVQYAFYIDDHAGDWRDGLRMLFQERWIYDLENFDNALFERKDLQWIRHSYLLLLQFAWDHEYRDVLLGKNNYDKFLLSKNDLIGGFEAYMIWPTWPRLGLDERNQWDMYRDLPGGLGELRRQAEYAHRHGSKYFIAYNPWDESTRHEDHLKGMEEVLRATNTDGVVLDTWGESTKEFQAAADRVKPGIILYSEGMAIPKDMPTIVAGRVHDAIYMPPPLNLNKLIKPEFAIFRVAQLAEGRIHRETAVAFFNGYGTELNIMRPGRPDWVDEELAYLGRTTKILRENSSAFLSREWIPLLPTLADSIWVNEWPTASKTLYTVYSLKPDGWDGPLFEVQPANGFHFVSLWHHAELDTDNIGGKIYIPVTVDGFNRSWIGTRREGSLDCIARFPDLLNVSLNQDSLHFQASQGSRIVIWGGDPMYERKFVEFPIAARTISLIEHLGRHEEKFVVQLFDGEELLDERVVSVPLATPRLISHIERTPRTGKTPDGMREIPAGTFAYKTMRSFLSPNEVIPYPGGSGVQTAHVERFFIDTYPVTNGQFSSFLKASRYKPKDTTNYLRHWVKGNPPVGLERHPVIYVSLEDARAYAKWAGKRLPTEIEWQYAAQGTDGRKYPWGEAFDSTRCNSSRGKTTPVDAFPQGQSPFGVMDLVGNVWQLTSDVYDNGTFYFVMIRGGCYYNPSSSWWYIKGGPQPVDNPQVLLMVSPGFDRSGTVGFRCVKDAQ